MQGEKDRLNIHNVNEFMPYPSQMSMRKDLLIGDLEGQWGWGDM